MGCGGVRSQHPVTKRWERPGAHGGVLGVGKAGGKGPTLSEVTFATVGVRGHWLVALGSSVGGDTAIWSVSWKLVSLLGIKCHRYRRPLYGFWSCVMSHPGHLLCLLEYLS